MSRVWTRNEFALQTHMKANLFDIMLNLEETKTKYIFSYAPFVANFDTINKSFHATNWLVYLWRHYQTYWTFGGKLFHI